MGKSPLREKRKEKPQSAKFCENHNDMASGEKRKNDTVGEGSSSRLLLQWWLHFPTQKPDHNQCNYRGEKRVRNVRGPSTTSRHRHARRGEALLAALRHTEVQPACGLRIEWNFSHDVSTGPVLTYGNERVRRVGALLHRAADARRVCPHHLREVPGLARRVQPPEAALRTGLADGAVPVVLHLSVPSVSDASTTWFHANYLVKVFSDVVEA